MIWESGHIGGGHPLSCTDKIIFILKYKTMWYTPTQKIFMLGWKDRTEVLE